MTLNIITITCRHNYLPRLLENIRTVSTSGHLELSWLVRFAPSRVVETTEPATLRPGWKAHIERFDEVLAGMPDGWFLCLSDDNILHPELPKRLLDLAVANPNVKAFHFSQRHRGGVRKGLASELSFGLVDGGQVVMDASYFKSFNWSWDNFSGMEGELFQRMKECDPEKWLHVDEVLTFHNGYSCF